MCLAETGVPDGTLPALYLLGGLMFIAVLVYHVLGIISQWKKLTGPKEIVAKALPEVPVVSAGEMKRIEDAWRSKFEDHDKQIAGLWHEITMLRQQLQRWMLQQSERVTRLESRLDMPPRTERSAEESDA